MTHAILFSTVVDEGHDKGILAYALIASWHQWCREWSYLRILLVGDDSKLERFALSLGASVSHHQQHPLSPILPFANKWLIAENESRDHRVILLDTDVVFTGDPWLLRALPDHSFAVRTAPWLRIPPPLQRALAQAFAIPTALTVAPISLSRNLANAEDLNAVSAETFIRLFRYYNSGIVAFPRGWVAAAVDRWRVRYLEIMARYDAFLAICGREDAERCLKRSDQMAFALAVLDQRVVELDCCHNFMGDAMAGFSVDDIALVHLAGPVKLSSSNPGHVLLEVFHSMHGNRRDLEHLRDHMVRLVDSYRLCEA